MDTIIPTTLIDEILNELHQEAQQRRPTLIEVLDKYSPLPRAALFFGVAEDHLPVLLDLENAVVGSLLIMGDAGSGKTRLLRLVARALIQTKDAAQVRFTVITRNTDEWKDLARSPHCEGVFIASETKAADMLYTLAARGHTDREQSFTLLFLDDLSLVDSLEYEIRLHTQWLLARGPKRKIWPIVTYTPRYGEMMHPWTGIFRTHLFARIADSRQVQRLEQVLSLPSEPPFGELHTGRDYTLPENNRWLRFWIPEE